MTAFFTLAEIDLLATDILSKSLSIAEIELPSAYFNSEIAEMSWIFLLCWFSEFLKGVMNLDSFIC